MNSFILLNGHWQFNAVSLTVIVLLLLLHFRTNEMRYTKESTIFLAGIVFLILATFSPLDYLGRNMLFSAHMIQHIIVLLLVPPLLLTGLNKEYLERLSRNRIFRKTGTYIFHPFFAWAIGVGSMWITHIPGLMMKMKGSDLVMDLQTISLLLFGFVFIWPVFTPVKFRKLDPLQSSIYLFLACVGCTTLGILITFAPPGIFTSDMADMNPDLGTLIRSGWGITPEIDQQMGGLIMWVPACIIYLTYVLITLTRWLSSQGAAENAAGKITSGDPGTAENTR